MKVDSNTTLGFSMSGLKRVLIMAGGTGGHVFPGLAVAQKLIDNGVDVKWLGSKGGMETKIIPKHGIYLSYLKISGLRGKKRLRTYLLAPFKLMFAVFQAIGIIIKFKPNVILGFGGFVSGPGGIASFILRYPLVIHEQNAKIGMTNFWLSLVAKKSLTAFPNTISSGICIGNPVRTKISAVSLSQKHTYFTNLGKMRLLILGGSRGAVVINNILPRAIAALDIDLIPEILHQTGENNYVDSLSVWQKVGVDATVKPFIDDIAAAYQWADFVVARAGALTVTELCAAGRGALFIPYPYAVDDHQTANASFMVKAGAAEIIQQKNLTVENLVVRLSKLFSSPKNIKKMGFTARSLYKDDAVSRVVAICEEVCR